MKELKVFENEKFGEIRTLIVNDEPYFVGKDVASILGYKDTNQAIRNHVDECDKLSRDFNGSGQNRQMYVINESGLYSLIFLSKLPQAKEFKRWVTHDVLPSIRRHGAYMNNETLEKALTSPDFLLQLATKLKEQDERIKKFEKTHRAYDVALKLREQQILEMQPKASYYDDILKSDNLICTSVIAKDYGMSAKSFNRMLNDLGIQYNLGGVWLLYSKYQNGGYTKTETYSIINTDETKVLTKWTQKGRIFLYEKLKKKGILPIMEK